MIALLIAMLAAQPTELESAKSSFDRGMQHYNMGEFDRALSEFKKAYGVQPHPDLLFNIGQCYRNLGNVDEAIFFFERYLEEKPDADEVRALLAEMRKPVVYDPPPLDSSTTSLGQYDLSIPPLPPPEKPPLVERWWFWAAVMSAAAFTAGGVVLVASLADSDPTTNRSFDPSL